MLVTPLVIERVITLPPEPRSAAAARAFVRAALVEGGQEGWVELAELAVSELVTNGILHAHTPLAVTVQVSASDVTVRVRDDSLQLPAQRHWGASATTGRGLALVASLAAAYGVDAEPDGKTVWFRLDDSLATGGWAAFDLEGWDESVLGSFDQEPVEATIVGLERVPVLLWLAAQQHHEAVLRELFLVQADSRAGGRPLDLLGAGRALAALSAAVAVGVATAIAGGAELSQLPAGHPSPLPAVPPSVEADVVVPADAHADFAALQDVLDVGLRLGAADQMLIRPALPEIVALRDWACEQVLAQVNGVPSSPWGGVAHPRFIDPSSARDTAPAPVWDDSRVRATDRAVVAADDNNRIVAVSEAAATLLKWPAAQLEGRRVVTIVPERLREAHVAGFTRHLTTGEAHVIGVPISLPTLRGDGSEITCEFLIERAATGTPGRAVYLAWLTPQD